VGTEFGLYVTLDGCKEWKKFMNNLPSVRVDDILIHPRDRDLIVATHGRSLWIADDISPLEQWKPMSGQTSLMLFDPRPAVLWKNDLAASRAARNREFKGQNPPGGTAINVWAKTGIGTAKLDFLLGATVASTMAIEIKAGMNRFQWNLQKAQPAANGGRGGRGGAASAPDAVPTGGQAGGPGAAAIVTSATGTAVPTPTPQAAAPAADAAFAGGQASRGRGAGGPVPFIIGERGGGGFGGFGGGGPVDPGVYIVRLTVGDKTFTSSVNVLEDIWVRPQ
jgi:hypothetical protein